MPSPLESCPAEIVECIVRLLDLKDICSLRLSCISLAAKSSQYRFKTFFRSQHVDVTTDALEAFAQGLPAKGASIANRGSLRSPTLRVAVFREENDRVLPVEVHQLCVSKILWQCTTQTFATALRALAASTLRIESLNVYNDLDMQRCSLACEQLNIIDWNDAGLAKSLETLSSLSISISTEVFGFQEDDYENEYDLKKQSAEAQAKAEDETNFLGLSRLFQLCNRLENFELHFLRVYSNIMHHFNCEIILKHVVELKQLPRLKRCSLRGMPAREVDLLEFIKWTNVCELSLESVKLQAGTFKSIIEYCTSETANITKVYFNALYERHDHIEMIFFDGGGKSRVGFYSERDRASEWLEREGNIIRRPITYHLRLRWGMRNPYMVEWRRSQRTEYGPRLLDHASNCLPFDL
ncbi:Fc.00g003960.m01.CDS01 [Cosmosporella sp. VM-42]